MVPITILTGFLGAGKTTILNEIIKQQPDKKFGLVINEFGAEGIDGKLVEAGDEEIVELSNGCVCCVVRKDLQDAVEKLLEQNDSSENKIDYVIIETSGLAEPIPVAQTFAMDNLDGKVALDAIVCLIDAENYAETTVKYDVVKVQIQAADIIVINKINSKSATNIPQIEADIKQYNPYAAVIKNQDNNINTSLLIETGKWTIDKLQAYGLNPETASDEDHSHNEDNEAGHHHEHEHEHNHVDEVVFQTNSPFDAEKLNSWVLEKFPANAVRAKGIIRLQLFPGQFGLFLFQMVGATRMLVPFIPKQEDFDSSKSTLVLIGKGLDQERITQELQQLIV